MKKVRMKYTISGGRADGSQWPAAGEELSCLAAEANELVAAGIAENVESSGAADDEGSSARGPAAPEPEKDASVYPPREQPKSAAKK